MPIIIAILVLLTLEIKVFSCLPPNPKTLYMSKCVKLTPHYFGPFIDLKRAGSFASHLDLLDGLNVHPILFVSCLKGLTSFNNNIITTKDVVTREDLSFKPYLVEKLLDSQTKHLKSKQIRGFTNFWIGPTMSRRRCTEML